MNHEHGTRYIRVIVDRAIHRELDYSVPESLADRVGVGSRVRVPFRDKSALATVVGIPQQSEAKGIRPIEAIVGDAPVLTEQLLELTKWIGTYYCCPIEAVMRSVLPQVIRRAEIGWKKQLFVQPLPIRAIAVQGKRILFNENNSFLPSLRNGYAFQATEFGKAASASQVT